jgi:transcription initiation factor TFIIH subunit 2
MQSGQIESLYNDFANFSLPRQLLENFVVEFFDQNPIGQLGIIVSRNKRSEKVTELGGNPKRHIKALQTLAGKTCQGEPSLQNSLELALQTLRRVGH